jgi:hypothetical protein
MPVLPAVANCIKSVFTSAMGDAPDMLNRLFWKLSAPATQAFLNAFTSEMVTAWTAHMTPYQTEYLTLKETYAEALDSLSAPTSTLGTSVAGGYATAGPPADLALLINFDTARRWRGGHPRISVPGIPVAYLNTPQTWTATIVGDVAAAWALFVAAMLAVTNGGITVVDQVSIPYYKGFTNGVGSTGRARVIPTLQAAPVPDIVTSFSVNPVIGSIRRRNEHP